MQAWGFFLLIMAPLIGGAAAIFMKKSSLENYKLVLSFSGAFLFSVSLIHLFPVVFDNNENAGIYVLAGFFIQVLLEQLTHGIEHGHFHQHQEHHKYIFGLLMGLTIHSFFDGIPLSDFKMLEQSHHSLLFGISIHKIPEGFALASVLLFSNYKKLTVVFIVLLFSFAAPAAVLLSNTFSAAGNGLFSIIVPMAVGSFLHVSTTILFESESKQHFFGWKKIIAILLGAGISLLTI
ncbi:MAG: ZIP family metal transporter [Chitinophagales bacterium]|jgi:zinc transporter ZupT|nr:ZIP family metal transporter [Chitinophagales bacterium]